MKKTYDLIITSSGNVKVMTRGFFEHIHELSLCETMPELIETDKYRFTASDYKRYKAKIDKFIK